MGKVVDKKTVFNEHAAGLSLSLSLSEKKKIVIRDNMHTASLSINNLKHTAKKDAFIMKRKRLPLTYIRIPQFPLLPITALSHTSVKPLFDSVRPGAICRL